jgi:hypothetical protein
VKTKRYSFLLGGLTNEITMRTLAEIIAQELATPLGRNLQERFLEAMFLMERSRGVDAGWSDVVPHIGDADVGVDSISHLAKALRTFIQSHPEHPNVGSAIWALGALRADDDAGLFKAVLRTDSGYGPHAREQAQCALEVIRL